MNKFKLKFLERQYRDNREGNKYLGAYLPQELHHYLSLKSLNDGITINTIVQSMTNEWFAKQTESTAKLTKNIYIKAQEDWRREKAGFEIKNNSKKEIQEYFEIYKTQLYDTLLKRGVSDKSAKRIIKNIKYE